MTDCGGAQEHVRACVRALARMRVPVVCSRAPQVIHVLSQPANIITLYREDFTDYAEANDGYAL